MWRSTRSTASQMEKHVADDSKWMPCHEDESVGNVDSGFLSGGNLQYSGEIHDSGLVASGHQRQDEHLQSEQRPATAAAVSSSLSSSASSVSTGIAKEPMRTVDSGVDVDLIENLSHLNLKHVSLNPLSDATNRIQAEPTDAELVPVTRNDESTQWYAASRDEQLGSRTCEGSSEENWQLYYTQDNDGDMQLHIAIIQGFEKIALNLISMAPHSRLLNIMNNDWQSPLHLAVLTQQPTIVRRLILAGADPSLRNFHGNTALHLACANGDLACTKALTDPLTSIERNKLTPGKEVPAIPQDLEQRNYAGQMCLHVAAANGHTGVVQLLIRHGADLKAREGLEGYTALHIAVKEQYRSLFDLLLLECQRARCLDVQTYYGRTAYQLTQEYSGPFFKEACKKLVRYGATPEPLPESDSDSSEDDETTLSSTMNYLAAIDNLQNAVGVKV